jgi:chromosome segregation ATPase
MDKDLQKIDQKIDKLTEVVSATNKRVDKLADAVTEGFDAMGKRLDSVEEKVEVLTETVVFMKDRMVTKEEMKEAFVESEKKIDMKFRMAEGHLNVIEQKLDENIEKQSDLTIRVTRLESAHS